MGHQLVFLFLSAVSVLSGEHPNNPFYLVECIEANLNKESACLDGSPQTFYFRDGHDDGITKYVIHMEGGGWCSGIDNNIASSCGWSCFARSKGYYGSSVADPPYLTHMRVSNQYALNPLSYNWNMVFIRYCDGASFSGNNMTDTFAEDGTQIYFRGFNNLKAVLDLLKLEYGLDTATDVILTGTSAGGLATWLHADFVADYVGPNVNFMSKPIGGFFVDYEGDGMYDSCMNWIFEYQNTSIALNDECMNAQNEDTYYKCMFAQYNAPFIESKIIAFQSRFDTWQRNKELGSMDVTKINEYGNELTNVIMDVFIDNGQYSTNHALWLDSCLHHTQKWEDIVIDGSYAINAEVDWYYGNSSSQVYFQDMTYPCDSCCAKRKVNISTK